LTALTPGTTASVERLVEESDLAAAISPDPEDRFPRVFATSRLVALMELAAARLMRPLLTEGELSVGVSLEITHEAPTPPGAVVRATAKFLATEGKVYRFEVTAEDGAGPIGRGTHGRAIVTTERLVAGARKRLGGASGSSGD
jgi:fluoroacetyl-CoA thioesterase